ncbi:DUF2334 domain-containing protein [Amycolatopsis sp. WGS_07]|uniref:DUF2334 domain-containing protein n=1 Tax=Amycolatopsis sp. WGS_07 TaxID=3076764 RepID=UPI003872B9BC
MNQRFPAWLRLGIIVVAVVSLVGGIVVVVSDDGSGSAAADPVEPVLRQPKIGMAGPGGRDDRRTLVLFDDGRRLRPSPPATQVAEEAQANAIQTANLVSRSTAWRMLPAADYRRGELNEYQAVVYVGTVYDAQLPSALLDDVSRTRLPVMWIGSNIWQLFDRAPELAGKWGWTWAPFREDKVTTVSYRDTELRRDPNAGIDVVGVRVTSPKAKVLAQAKSAEGVTSPWAVHSGSFTYLAEVPYSYVGAGDRYLAAADILLGVLAPDAPERRRALVRVEDIGPRTPPAEVRAITDYLSGHGVPFSLAVYPYYADPRGSANGGKPTFARLVDSPELVVALRDAVARGGTLVMHGYSHQYGETGNPYSATSAADYEFYRATVDHQDNVRLSGPVPEDSPEWFRGRIATGLAEFDRVGLPRPDSFEFPHYGGSAVDYQEAGRIFPARYDRGSYYAGQCDGGQCGRTDVSYREVYGQFFPYPVRDVYGTVVVPENVGNVAPAKFNQHAARTADDILADAKTHRVVTDSVVSFFYHPFLGIGDLRKVVEGIEGLGYRFVSPAAVAA